MPQKFSWKWQVLINQRENSILALVLLVLCMVIDKWLHSCSRQFKLEREFTTWHLKQCSDLWALSFKLSDADRRTKPFDAFVVLDWSSYFIEYKITKNMSCKPYRLLEGSSLKKPWWQVSWLSKVVKNGWIALVIVYSTKCKKYHISNFSELDFNTTISYEE